MKILLIQPKLHTHVVTPPLGLGYLASTLINEGHEVKLLDCIAFNIDIFKTIKEFIPDFIGLTVLTISYNVVINLIKDIKASGCTAKIVIGGPHVSALPTQCLKDTHADFCIIGEGEITFKELCSNNNYKEINGLAYFNEGVITVNPQRELIKNINTIPFPAWNIIKPNEYPPTPHGAFYKRFPVAPIITTRGCPYNCTFCASKCIWKQKLRVRSAINVVDEIEYLNSEFGIKEFHFEDDNFTFSKVHVVNVCNEIIKRKLDITWTCPNGVRIDKLDKEIIHTMKQAGCYQLSFGIESGNQKILDSINKHLNLKIVPDIIENIKQEGMTVCGFFIIGLPEDTEKTIEDTINFALSTKFDRVQFNRFIPLPGTEPFDSWYNEQSDFDWDMTCWQSTYKTVNLSNDEISKLQQKAFRKFYLRPKIIFKIIREIKLIQYYWILKRMKDYKM